MIERQHRTLKDRLISRACASGDSSWMEHLPFVLLGLRTSVRADSGCAPSDLLYGSPLRLPGDVVLVGQSAIPPPASEFASQLQSTMRRSSPMPVLHHGSPASSRVDAGLASASHAFLRVDAVKRPLVPPYEGPFQILERSQNNKTFVILRRDKPVTVTVDRLKPAVFLPESNPALSRRAVPPTPSPTPAPAPSPPPAPQPVSSCLDPVDWPLPTRFGRRPRPPDRLNL